jgi:hypothetical protein
MFDKNQAESSIDKINPAENLINSFTTGFTYISIMRHARGLLSGIHP